MKRTVKGNLLAPLGMLTILAGVGCVSVSLSSKPTLRHAEVHLSPPTAPFETFANEKSDGAWRNARNGNSISYFSNCNDPADPSLESVRQELLSGIQGINLLDTQNIQYNGREGLRTLATGKVDGVNAKMDILVFKKNLCIYGLSYVGLAQSFNADHAAFDGFVRGFEAP